MTQHEANRHIKEIIAFAKGKKIQWYDEGECKWVDIAKPEFYITVKYRIKPQIKVVPLTADDLGNECIIMRTRHPDWDIHNTIYKLQGITLDKQNVIISVNEFTHFWIVSFDYLRDNFTRLDGSRFEKEIEVEGE